MIVQRLASARGIAGLALIALVMVAVLLALGAWQLQRRVAKQALIAALTERLAAAPMPLPPPSDWADLSPARDEFRRVTFTARFTDAPDAMIYSAGSAIRADVTAPGTFALLPVQLRDGSELVVNAGFLGNPAIDRAVQDRAVQRLRGAGAVQMVGYLRFPERSTLLIAAPDPAKRLWFARDLTAIAAALGWDSAAPFYIDLEAPQLASDAPRPGPLTVRLRDQHLQYAITWFGLAAVVSLVFAAWLYGQLRDRRSIKRRSVSL